ncbi:uncharacterized protein TNCV_2891461 [Trichonephila clavipes]|nr:uncharacterized protein TNCV_2891461 [Trichonephila clavipes]
MAPPLPTTTPHQREDVSALDRFNVHHYPTRWVFSGSGVELMIKPAMIRYLYHSATTATTSQSTVSLEQEQMSPVRKRAQELNSSKLVD